MSFAAQCGSIDEDDDDDVGQIRNAPQFIDTQHNGASVQVFGLGSVLLLYDKMAELSRISVYYDTILPFDTLPIKYAFAKF